MTAKNGTSREVYRAHVERALARAARRARAIARRTGTPIVIVRDGKIVHERVDDDAEGSPAARVRPLP